MTTGERHGPGAVVTRRAALGAVAALGAAAVAGCTPAPGGAQAAATPTSPGATSSSEATGSGTTDPSDAAGGSGTPSDDSSAPDTARLDPDVALAAVVLREEQVLLDRVTATVRAHPRLSRTLAGARAAHRAHVDLLTDAVPEEQLPAASPSTPPKVARRAPAALTALARAEATLAASGRRHALAARSGAFARVLAGTSAAAQQLSVQLSTAPGTRR